MSSTAQSRKQGRFIVTTKRKLHYVPAALLAAVFCGACGAAKPSAELVSARDAYTRARTGEAAQLNPKGVHDAYKALQAAESVHAEDAGSDVEKHYAYIAARKSELAISEASAELARREQQRADETYGQNLEQRTQAVAAERSQYQQQLSTTQQELQHRSETLEEQRERLEEQSQRMEQAQRDAERAKAELQQMQSMREEAGRMIISLSGVLFPTGSTELTPMAEQRLDTVARALGAYEGRPIIIEGHTDAQGDDEANRQLSLQRAAAVREYLERRGVPMERLHIVGKGESEPLASNDTPEGRANNRRVEIIVDRPGAIGPERQNTSGQDTATERENTSGREGANGRSKSGQKQPQQSGQGNPQPGPAEAEPGPDETP